MIRLFKVKEKQRELAESAVGGAPVKKQTAGELRLNKGWFIFNKNSYVTKVILKVEDDFMEGGSSLLVILKFCVTYASHGGYSNRCLKVKGQGDISELNLPKTCSIIFPNGKDDLMNFEVSIRPDEGYYMGGTFIFTFQVSPIYPHEAPKVKCKTKVYHPNIDLEGNVCLNILREDWKPVLNINTIIYGLFHLFTQPNHEDPLNHDAAAVLRDNPKLFESNVRRAMSGGYVGQTFFPRCV
ncbi:Ubiquitin-conjugating enzyme E2 [Dillenia turbinata]|uniref:Ubiquitin-conjugating enzyme E2 n=1 Tax=Dillenia turbinata TaxID=194707 RepID=A0AAN8UT51_9MAGN